MSDLSRRRRQRLLNAHDRHSPPFTREKKAIGTYEKLKMNTRSWRENERYYANTLLSWVVHLRCAPTDIFMTWNKNMKIIYQHLIHLLKPLSLSHSSCAIWNQFSILLDTFFNFLKCFDSHTWDLRETDIGQVENWFMKNALVIARDNKHYFSNIIYIKMCVNYAIVNFCCMERLLTMPIKCMCKRRVRERGKMSLKANERH